MEFVSNVYPVEGRQVIRCNIRDISDRKQAEAGAAGGDRRKDEFLSDAGPRAAQSARPHPQCRRGHAAQRHAGPRVRWAQGVTERQVQQLSRLVDDLLDVSRFNQGKINLKMEPVDLAAVVARAVEISRPLIDAHKHSLTVSLPEQAVRVQGDMTRLAQVLSNLLNNAAKYTEDGRRIDVTVTASGAKRSCACGTRASASRRNAAADLRDVRPGARLGRPCGGRAGHRSDLVRSLVQMHGGTVGGAQRRPWPRQRIRRSPAVLP